MDGRATRQYDVCTYDFACEPPLVRWSSWDTLTEAKRQARKERTSMNRRLGRKPLQEWPASPQNFSWVETVRRVCLYSEDKYLQGIKIVRMR